MIPLFATLLILSCGAVMAVTVRGSWGKVRRYGPWRYWFPR